MSTTEETLAIACSLLDYLQVRRSRDDIRQVYKRLRVTGEMNFAPTMWVEAFD
jgi:hypothetical protein